MTLPLLPQDDPQGDRRGAALAWAQQAYTYRYDALAPLATIANLPATEHFDIRYNALQLGTMSRISANMGMVTVRNDLEPFQGLQEYEEFYPLLPKPSSLSNHHDDRSFARQRVAGANPMVLRRVIDARELADMDLAGQFTAITGLPSLEAGVASGQLFVADYRMFADTVTGTHGGRPKWLAPAVALFCWRPSGLADRGGLAPVAIRLSPRSVTVTPKDGAAWQAAKTHVQVADANHHEMSTHLGRTHLVMEPFAIATARQLAPNHPLRLLLDPHLRFNLARNALARETLIKQDGPVDRLLAGTLQSSLKIATEAAASWHFENFKLPNELKSRGVDDADLLPDYPYRDDGLLLWDSIGAFAREYVGLYYSSPASVQGDVEVQAWRTEISAQNGGRILGVPEEVATPDALAAILQQIIFTAGPQHSAVNYPQWDFVGAPANMPLAAYASFEPPPNSTDTLSDAVLPILPPPGQVRDQIEVMRFLTGWQYDRLGSYPKDHFGDPRAQAAVSRFQAALNIAERRIHDRNTRRVQPYEYLLPSNILNSSSI